MFIRVKLRPDRVKLEMCTFGDRRRGHTKAPNLPPGQTRVVASAHAVPAGGVGFFVRAAGARSALRAAGVRSEGESQILAFQH